MRVAILSDIHSNLEALEAVLVDAKKNGVTHYVILGDTVGYGPNPEECVNIVRNLNPRFAVMGNHDLCCTGVRMDMNHKAELAIEWTKNNISPGTKRWLEHLPFTAKRGDCVFVHSTLVRPRTFNYFMFTMRHTHICEQMALGKKVCFLGHSHGPEMVVWDEKQGLCMPAVPFFELGVEAPVDRSLYNVVNAGSVGQPRDFQWMSTYIICDMHNWSPRTVSLRRVPYDAEKTAQKVFDSELPNYHGERLLKFKVDNK